MDILRDILWEMNDVDYSTHTESHEVEVTTTNDDGEEETTTETVTETVLTIEITHKTASDMAQEYRFDRRQKEYLDLMMQPDNQNLWAQLLGGLVAGGGQIITPDTDWVQKYAATNEYKLLSGGHLHEMAYSIFLLTISAELVRLVLVPLFHRLSQKKHQILSAGAAVLALVLCGVWSGGQIREYQMKIQDRSGYTYVENVGYLSELGKSLPQCQVMNSKMGKK